MSRKVSEVYQIKVTLNETHPPIWRRIQAPAITSLFKLHDILQIVMGWEDYHLHMFTIDYKNYGDPQDDEFGELGTKDEIHYRLHQVVPGEGFRFTYEYDFGDGWEHTLLVEKILPAEEGVRYPRCVSGKRACPPEDVGGVWGYEVFLHAIRDPRHPEHDEYLEWIGGKFDPQAFDLEAVNAALDGMERRSREASSVWSQEDQAGIVFVDSSSAWIDELPEDQWADAEKLALRQDMVTLLNYLRDHRLSGTQSTGNLPLKAVREICAQFVSPPRMEERIGDYVFRVRSEAQVWPLYFVHILASHGALLSGGLGRRWRLTDQGELFLAMPAPLQAWFLFLAWWTQVDWEIASPFGIRGDSVIDRFRQPVLDHLLAISVGTRVLFEPFADRLVEDIGLVWSTQDQDYARQGSRAIIERIVIEPLVDLGILRPEHGPHKTLRGRYKELIAFYITPFGRSLLELMKTGQP